MNYKDRECKYWWFDGWDWLVNRALDVVGRPLIETAPGEIAIDPHVHTLFSHCSISRPDRLILWAARLGLGGITVTDHHDVRGAIEALRCVEDLKLKKLIPEGFLVIPGVEMNSDVGHIGALFVTERLPESLSVGETVRVIHEAGGLAVAVHPFHSTGIREAVFDAPFDAVEVECGAVFDRRLVRLNYELSLEPRLSHAAKIGASDAHYVRAIGSCYTVLTVKEPTLESAKQAIIDGLASPRTSAHCVRLRKLLGGIPKLK